MIDSITLFFFTDGSTRSQAFYETVFELHFAAQGPHWRQAPAGAARFALHGREAGDTTKPGVDHAFFGFNVRDVHAVVARCREAGGTVLEDVYDEAFGKVALIADPEGRRLRVVQH